MFACPKGHQSQAGDYCDECGALIGGVSEASQPATPNAAASQPASSTTPGAAPDATTPEPDGPCPECDTARTGRFCEVCGHDFVLADLASPPDGAPPGTVSPEVASPGTTSSGTPPDATSPGGWHLVVSADRAYHARMQAHADADAEPIPFPEFLPQRRFTLSGEQILIGRPSRSRGIEPEIDLSGPPADPAVSHAHALLVARSGGWSVVDLQSSNGTYVNGDETPLSPHTPTPLRDGDVVHVGAWTALTLGAPQDQR